MQDNEGLGNQFDKMTLDNRHYGSGIITDRPILEMGGTAVNGMSMSDLSSRNYPGSFHTNLD